jgi:alkaline phosphatase D
MTIQPPDPANPRSALSLDRRSLFRSGILAAGLATLPAAASGSGLRGFTHGVASGEPGAAQVLLWTRFVSASDTTLRYEVSESVDFARVASGGETRATPVRDGCVKPIATGLEPDRWYYFRFIAPDGLMSDIGRTRTLPAQDTARFRLAVVGCSNFGFGWFNAYAHIAETDQTDLVVHTGDYIYEYGAGTYPTAEQALSGRTLNPQTEIVALADYRLRYATYRSDPDLQRLHQLFPMIAIPDDHESANDSYRDGAENHDPATEGSWDVRKRAAMQAYREWMPISDEPYAEYDLGNLGTIFRLETRLIGRDKPFDLTDVVKGTANDPDKLTAALTAFRDGEWRDAGRSLMGQTQEEWFYAGLKKSRSAGKVWQVLAQQVVMSSMTLSLPVTEDMMAALPDYVRERLRAALATSEVGVPFNMDAWDGYPAARERLLSAAQEAEANLLVLAGDSHNAWASNLDNQGTAAGIEFAGHSVSSPGAEAYLPWIKPQDLAARQVAANPQLQWADTSLRGYMAVELTPTRATTDYHFLQGVKSRGVALAGSKRITSEAGSQKLSFG